MLKRVLEFINTYVPTDQTSSARATAAPRTFQRWDIAQASSANDMVAPCPLSLLPESPSSSDTPSRARAFRESPRTAASAARPACVTPPRPCAARTTEIQVPAHKLLPPTDLQGSVLPVLASGPLVRSDCSGQQSLWSWSEASLRIAFQSLCARTQQRHGVVLFQSLILPNQPRRIAYGCLHLTRPFLSSCFRIVK